MKKPPLVRFLEKVSALERRCWVWSGATDSSGYGSFKVAGRAWIAHRWIWQLWCGGIPPGMQLDHTCRNRRCVRPSHLRLVTSRENTMAPGSLAPAKRNAEKTECIRGHPLSGANVLWERGRRTIRHCRECRRTRPERMAAARGAAGAEISL